MTLSITLDGIYPPSKNIDETDILLYCRYYVSPSNDSSVSGSFPLAQVMRIFEELGCPYVSRALNRSVREIVSEGSTGLRLRMSDPLEYGLTRTNFMPDDPLLRSNLVAFQCDEVGYEIFLSKYFSKEYGMKLPL